MINILEHSPGTNKIIVPPNRIDIKINIDVAGDNNIIDISNPHHCASLSVKMTGNNTLFIGPGCTFHGQQIFLVSPGELSIGSGCGFNGRSRIQMHESACIRIGNECLFADGVIISSSHVHKILDVDTGERLNPPGNITIRDHVWVSEGASIWGGADIGSDSIVGKDVYVSKPFPANCLIAGVPARVIRERVTWQG